ncbi:MULTISPECIES: hypothetical protein [Fischerella]|uniref:hypothetical protein n=1 Tax=Fischerella TaxID=1190 RepID=UPI0012F79738|nr:MULTISPECIES: hypothetical protein [Fischerella]MBD2431296.1 hypothetical protein [Fischerella sp. FACHB-380]
MVINSFCQGSQKLLPQAKTFGVPFLPTQQIHRLHERLQHSSIAAFWCWLQTSRCCM